MRKLPETIWYASISLSSASFRPLKSFSSISPRASSALFVGAKTVKGPSYYKVTNKED